MRLQAQRALLGERGTLPAVLKLRLRQQVQLLQDCGLEKDVRALVKAILACPVASLRRSGLAACGQELLGHRKIGLHHAQRTASGTSL